MLYKHLWSRFICIWHRIVHCPFMGQWTAHWPEDNHHNKETWPAFPTSVSSSINVMWPSKTYGQSPSWSCSRCRLIDSTSATAQARVQYACCERKHHWQCIYSSRTPSRSLYRRGNYRQTRYSSPRHCDPYLNAEVVKATDVRNFQPQQ